MKKSILRALSFSLLIIMVASMLPIGQVLAAGYDPTTDTPVLEEVNFNDYAPLTEDTAQYSNGSGINSGNAASSVFSDTTSTWQARRIAPVDESANVRIVYTASTKTYELYELTDITRNSDDSYTPTWTLVAQRKALVSVNPIFNIRAYYVKNQAIDYYYCAKNVTYTQGNTTAVLNFNDVKSSWLSSATQFTSDSVSVSDDGHELILSSPTIPTSGAADGSFGGSVSGVSSLSGITLDGSKDYTLEFFYQATERSTVRFAEYNGTYYGYTFGAAYAEDAVSADGSSLVLTNTNKKSLYQTKVSGYDLKNNTYTLQFDIESTDVLNDPLKVFFLNADGAEQGTDTRVASASTNYISYFGFATMTDTSLYSDGKVGNANVVDTARNLEWARWDRLGTDVYTSPYLVDDRNKLPTRLINADSHHRQSFKVVLGGSGSATTTVSIYTLAAETETYLLCGSTTVTLFDTTSFHFGIMSECELSEDEHVALKNVKIYSGDTTSPVTSDYASAAYGQLLYDVNFSERDGVLDYVANPWSISKARAINADSYTLNPYTGEADSALIIKRDILVAVDAAIDNASFKSGVTYYDNNPSNDRSANNVHMTSLPDFKVQGNVYTISFWGEKKNTDRSNEYDVSYYFLNDGTYRGFSDADSELNKNALLWKYNDGQEVFLPKTRTTKNASGNVTKTETLVEYGRDDSTFSTPVFSSKRGTTVAVSSTVTDVYDTKFYDSYLPSAVNRATDASNGCRQYYKVVVDCSDTTAPTLSVYALSVKGYYEHCGTKNLNSSGITANTCLMLGIYTYESPSSEDYCAMGGVKIYKGDITDAPITSEENEFLKAANAETTLDNGNVFSEANRLYTIDFRQSHSSNYGVIEKSGTFFNTLYNSAGFRWGMGDASNYHGNADLITPLTATYPIYCVDYTYKSGYGIRFSRTTSGAMATASYMPYKNNWQFGDYAIELHAQGNTVLCIAVLECEGLVAGFRTGVAYNNRVFKDRYNFELSTVTNGPTSSHGGRFTFYDYYNIDTFNADELPEGVKAIKDDYIKITSLNQVYKPDDGSANIRIEFNNSDNLITYYALMNTSTDANAVSLEWVPYGTIQYYDFWYTYDANGEIVKDEEGNPVTTPSVYKAMFGISSWTYNPVKDANGNITSYSDWLDISNAKVVGESFYSMYNEYEDGEAMLTVDFENADILGYDDAGELPNGNKSGYHWNPNASHVQAWDIVGVKTLDNDGDGFHETLLLSPSTDDEAEYDAINGKYSIRKEKVDGADFVGGVTTMVEAETTIRNNWKYGSFTLELSLNSDQPTIVGMVRAAETEGVHPWGFTLSGNNPELYNRKTAEGSLTGSDNMGYFHNARFCNGASFLYQDGVSSQNSTYCVDLLNTTGVSFKSYYYTGGYTALEAAKANDSNYRNFYPTRVDTRESGEKNVKIEFNNTLQQITLYELCYNDTNLADTEVDMTNGSSWYKIATIDISGAFEKNIEYVEPSIYFYTWEWDAEAYFTNIDIVRGLSAKYNKIENFDKIATGEKFITLETPLGTNFVTEETGFNTYGTNLPFDLVSFSSYTVDMLVNIDESAGSMQSLTLLKTSGSNFAYSSVGFTFDKNNTESLSPSFIVDGKTVSANNTLLANQVGVTFKLYDATTPRYYAEGLDANVKIEFNSMSRSITLYELSDVDSGSAVDLRYVRVAEMVYGDFSDYMALFEGTMAYENVTFSKGLTANNLGFRGKEISSPYAKDGVNENEVDIRFLASVDSENYYYVGASVYMIRKGEAGVQTSKTITRTIDRVGTSIVNPNDRFSDVTAEDLGGTLVYSITITGIPTFTLDWVELHITPFVLTQQFKPNGDFLYDDTTTADEIVQKWKGNEEQGIAADETLGKAGNENIVIIKDGGETNERESENYDMIERSVGFDGTQTDIRILSSNVYGHTSYKNEYRATVLANSIKSYSPDIVGFNEVWSWDYPQAGTLESAHEPIYYETLKRELEGRYTFIDWSKEDNYGYYVGQNTLDYVDSYSSINASVETCLKTAYGQGDCDTYCTCNFVASEPPIQMAIRTSADMEIVGKGWRYQSQAAGKVVDGVTYDKYQDPYEHLHGIAWVAVELANGKHVLYVDGHLNRPYTTKSEATNAAAYTKFRTEDLYASVKDAIAKVGWDEADTAVIMAGDMWMSTNASQAEPYNYLVDNGFKNAQLQAEQLWTPNHGTSHTCGKNTNAGRCLYCNWRLDVATNNACPKHDTVHGVSELANSDIDLVLYKNISALGHTTISKLQSIEISDHMPVVADFAFK